MQNQSQKRDLARINARMRENQRTKARIAAKVEHSAKMMQRHTFGAFLAHALKVVTRFLRGIFGVRINGYCTKKPYIYDGPARPKQPNALRFEVYMRRRGRKYKKAQRAA